MLFLENREQEIEIQLIYGFKWFMVFGLWFMVMVTAGFSSLEKGWKHLHCRPLIFREFF